MKIMHVGRIIGGVATSVNHIGKHLDPNNFDQVIVQDLSSPAKFLNKRGDLIPIYYLDLKRSPNPIKDILTLFALVKLITREKPDIIHCHSSKGGLVGRIAGLFTKVRTAYTPQAFSFLSTNNTLLKYVIIWYERLFQYFTDVLLACSESEKQRALNEIKFPPSKVIVWSNAMPLIVPKTTSIKEKYILNLGRPSYQKNTLELIEVIRKLVYDYSFNIKLKLVGVGIYSPLKKIVEQAILDNGLTTYVELIDWLDRDSTLKIVENAQCYITTARYEGLPYSILEAMSLGIPIIASDVDGNRDCIVHNESGYLVESGEIDSYCTRIITLLSDEKIHARFSLQGKKRFNQKFSIDKTISNLEIIYYKINNNK